MKLAKEFFEGLPHNLSSKSFHYLAAYFLACLAFLSLSYLVDWPGKELFELYIFQSFLFVTLCILWKKGFRPLWGLGSRVGLLFLFGFGFYLLILALLDFFLSGHFSALAYWPQLSAHEIFVALILAPVLEELFFRDFLLRSFWIESSRLISSILFSAVFFMLAHAGFHFGALALGLINGFLYFKFRSVGLCILIHMASNLLIHVLPKAFPHLNEVLSRFQYFHF